MKIRAAVAALALAVTFVAGPARADTTRVSVLAVVDRLIGGINVSDGAKIAAAYTPAPSIVDDFPPFHWQQAGAAKNWAKDFHDSLATGGYSHLHITRTQPSYFLHDGHRAYLSVPSTITWRFKGRIQTLRGGFAYSVVETEGAGWKIDASSWYTISFSE